MWACVFANVPVCFFLPFANQMYSPKGFFFPSTEWQEACNNSTHGQTTRRAHTLTAPAALSSALKVSTIIGDMHQRTKHCPQKSHLVKFLKDISGYLHSCLQFYTHAVANEACKPCRSLSVTVILSLLLKQHSNRMKLKSASCEAPKPPANHSLPVHRVSPLILSCILSTTRCCFAQGMIKCRGGADAARARVCGAWRWVQLLTAVNVTAWEPLKGLKHLSWVVWWACLLFAQS